jgi:hypothetical protein
MGRCKRLRTTVGELIREILYVSELPKSVLRIGLPTVEDMPDIASTPALLLLSLSMN